MVKRRNILSSIRKNKAPRKKRNDSGEMSKEYTHLRVPSALKNKLEELKDAYERTWGDQITYEEFLERLYDCALRVDTTVKIALEETAPSKKAKHRINTKTPKETTATVAPSIPNMDERMRWQLKYYFVKEGSDPIEAHLSKGKGKSSSFAATLDGLAKGYEYLVKNGWKLHDESGREIDSVTALEIKAEHTQWKEDSPFLPDFSDEDNEWADYFK